MLDWLDRECEAAMFRIESMICDRLGLSQPLPPPDPPPTFVAPQKKARRKRPKEEWAGGDDYFAPISDPDKIERLAHRGIEAVAFAEKHRAGIAGSVIGASDLMGIKLACPIMVDSSIHDDGGSIHSTCVDLRSGLPRFAVACIATGNQEPDRRRWSDLVIDVVTAIQALPTAYRPTGPGVAFSINSIYEFPSTGETGTYDRYVTIDDRGKIHPCMYYGASWFRAGRNFVKREGWVREKPDSRHGHLPSVLVAAVVLNAWKASHNHWIARVWKGDSSVRIPVPAFSIGKVFKDRERNEARRLAGLQHWVKAHDRVGGSMVRMHLRGLPDFDWRGFRVSIQMPGEWAKNKRRSISLEDDKKMVQEAPVVATSNALLYSMFRGAGIELLTDDALERCRVSALAEKVDLSVVKLIDEDNPLKQKYYLPALPAAEQTDRRMHMH